MSHMVRTPYLSDRYPWCNFVPQIAFAIVYLSTDRVPYDSHQHLVQFEPGHQEQFHHWVLASFITNVSRSSIPRKTAKPILSSLLTQPSILHVLASPNFSLHSITFPSIAHDSPKPLKHFSKVHGSITEHIILLYLWISINSTNRCPLTYKGISSSISIRPKVGNSQVGGGAFLIGVIDVIIPVTSAISSEKLSGSPFVDMSLDRYIRLSDRLVEFEASLKDKRTPLTSKFIIEAHKVEAKDLWERLKPVYEECLADIEHEAADDAQDPGGSSKDIEERASVNAAEIEMVKSKYNSAFATYCRCVEHLGVLLQEIDIPTSNVAPAQTQGFRLPPCEVPIFSGDYSSWPTFRDMFTAVCIRNPRLSPVEKLFHLSQRTKGEPHDIVGKVPLTNENFPIAWGNLTQRYENKRVLVNIQLKTLFNLAPIQSESSTSIKSLQRDINGCISLLKLYGIDVESWDPIFVFVCCNRLPDVTLTLWEQTLDDKTQLPKWTDLNTFLTNRHRTLESVSEIRRKDLNSRQPSTNNSCPKIGGKTVKTFQNKVTESSCRLCSNGSHAFRKCPKFLDMTPNQRLKEIKRFKLCLNCFSKVHSVNNCTSKYTCFKCSKRHNTLLHREQASSNPKATSATTPSPAPTDNKLSSIQSTSNDRGVVQTCFSSQSKAVLLGTAIVKICHNGFSYLARALVDSGSEGTFISERLFHNLQLPFKRTSATISGLNNTTSASVQRECRFILASNIDEGVGIPTSALVVPHLSGSLPSRTIDPSSLREIPNIPLADPRFFESSRIDLLIGGDLLPSVMLPGVQRHVCGTLVAQETVFGWVLTGPIPSETSNTSPHIVSYFCEISLDKEISRFWELEDLPRKTFLSPSEQFCEDLYAATTTRNHEGRYIVNLPFKEEFSQSIDIGESRKSAMAQFFRNEARLLRNPDFKIEYDRVIEEYGTLGHMTVVQSLKSSDSSRHYYLPHHAVVRPESKTTKVRVVFNASSPTSNGFSLNDVLHTGPVLQQDLVVLILRWRFFRYVFNGDITKMYRQILVHPDHRPYQRILFRHDPTDIIHDYELNTVTFGVNCAPFLAIRTIIQLANDIRSEYPLASDILLNSMYVDDALAGGHSICDTVKSRDQLIAALNSAGFSMRKWTSNTKEILSDLLPSQLLSEDFLEFDDRSTTKTLGIRWNASSDSFFFSSIEFPDMSNYTKREVLSRISSLFDPAGWLAPCLVIAKMIMQRIWAEGTKWDEEISHESLSLWKAFQSSYPLINSIKIPRWFGYTPSSDVQFHGFSDASEKAYAAVLYVRVVQGTSVSVHLVACKTKVAPLKTISIPRLELCGATLLSEMIDHFVPKLNIPKYSLYCWTDSTIVLSWLSKPPNFWSTFVANRVSKISQVICPSNWHHVRSEHNPADMASRGVGPQGLIDNFMWWNGPPWLSDPEENWPKFNCPSTDTIDIERRNIKVHFSYFKDFSDVLERFSSLPRAIRVIAYIYRFLFSTHPKFRSNYQRDSINISTSEILMVHDRLIAVSQKANFPNEYSALSAKKPIASNSPILSLNPFIDAEGIIRISGRLVSSPVLSYNEKHPILLPYNCQFSRLLVKFIHEVSIHGGNQLVLRLLRSKYWIIRAKNLIRTTINKCKPCIVYKHRCQTQLMSALPPERTDLSRPFTHTGVDFAGPFDIKHYTGRCCRITKGGCPAHIHSDNGTNFVGASRSLAKDFIKTSHLAVQSRYGFQGITWHFIPPGAPHMGGLWEAGVKSFKSHFRKVAGNFKHTFEEFQTLLARIEACLNSRPLCPLSDDPSELAALTPGHFLIGTPILMPVDPDVRECQASLLNRWQRLKVIHQHFCLRWKEEYLKELHKRYKWKMPNENLQDNAMVVVKEENTPPNEWRLGRIQKVRPGSDGRVRVADILTGRGTITRPISKLVVLFNESSQ
ncbi:uncharacterized protein LOC142224439 [Haematobia irritans]|uniref:uncharacterized protein LOC142224439 n=1 Tax=Haematobia irritans TaxID=7368 RepID=UPI003F4F81F1